MHASIEKRIKALQETLCILSTGNLDANTYATIKKKLNIKYAKNRIEQAPLVLIQSYLGLFPDGILGPQTMTKLENALNVNVTKYKSLAISTDAFNFIIDYAITSINLYNIHYQNPVWPGGESGVTIGIGYDLGYMSKQAFTETWGGLLSAADMQTLLPVIGLKGEKAHQALAGCKTVKIGYDKAIQVFYHTVLPACAKDTRKAFPGVQKLPPDAQGALLSLVYNRGPLINDTDKRKEMKAIVPLVAKGDLAGIAAQLRSMKRLWTSKGLISRREKEAVLTETASTAILPEAIIFV